MCSCHAGWPAPAGWVGALVRGGGLRSCRTGWDPWKGLRILSCTSLRTYGLTALTAAQQMLRTTVPVHQYILCIGAVHAMSNADVQILVLLELTDREQKQLLRMPSWSEQQAGCMAWRGCTAALGTRPQHLCLPLAAQLIKGLAEGFPSSNARPRS